MVVGRHAASLVLKKFEKRVSLDVFFLSVQRASITLAIQWPLLAAVSMGRRNTRLKPSILGFGPDGFVGAS